MTRFATAFAAIVLFTCAGSAQAAQIPWSQLRGLHRDAPPWPYQMAQLPDRIRLIGLEPLSAEGQVLHIHQHLDVYVNRTHVVLPAGVGIYDNSFITEVHTHDTSGIIHVESPSVRTFRLGQLFAEWGVRLTSSCVGRYCGDVHWWVNGKPRRGDPAQLALRAHEEIVIAAGRPPARIPGSYAFPLGY
jgi:hypothetical protein